MRHRPCAAIAAILVLSASGCSWQQAYYAGQEWQRNACYRLVDAMERERCLASTKTTYEDYRRQVEPPGDPATR